MKTILMNDETIKLIMSLEEVKKCNGIILDNVDDKEVSELEIKDDYRYVTVDQLVLGKNIKKLVINGSNDIVFIDIDNIFFNDKLEELSIKGNLRVKNILLNNNCNFELLNNYLYQKKNNSVILSLMNNNLLLPDDDRIKVLDYVVNDSKGVSDVFIPKNVELITDKILNTFKDYNFMINKDNKHYIIDNNCLIEKETKTLLKMFKKADIKDMDIEIIKGKAICNDTKYLICPKTCKVLDNVRVKMLLNKVKLPNNVEIKGRCYFACKSLTAYYIKNAYNLAFDTDELFTDIDTFNSLNDSNVSVLDNLDLIDTIYKKINSNITSFFNCTIRCENYIANKDYMVNLLDGELYYLNKNMIVKEAKIMDHTTVCFPSNRLDISGNIKKVNSIENITLLNDIDTIILKNGVERLEGESGNVLKHLYIPSSLNYIEDGYFEKYNLIHIEVSKQNKYFYKKDNALINKLTDEVICYELTQDFVDNADIEINYDTKRPIEDVIIFKNSDIPLENINSVLMVSKNNKRYKYINNNALIKDNKILLLNDLDILELEGVDTLLLSRKVRYLIMCKHLFDKGIYIPKTYKNIDTLTNLSDWCKDKFNNLLIDKDNPYIKEINNCFVDVVNGRVLGAKDNYIIPNDENINYLAFNLSMGDRIVLPSYFKYDKRFNSYYDIKHEDNKIIMEAIVEYEFESSDY